MPDQRADDGKNTTEPPNAKLRTVRDRTIAVAPSAAEQSTNETPKAREKPVATDRGSPSEGETAGDARRDNDSESRFD
jgi:hypothetical protein